MPTSSASPREQHKVFWSKGLTLPIGDKFWDSHRPGDLWNCKCWLQQTDEPATEQSDIPTGGNTPKPAKGLKGNPGKTGEVFTADHPYMPEKCKVCFLNRDGLVHGRGDVTDANEGVGKGNCMRCTESMCKLRSLSRHEITEDDISELRDNDVIVKTSIDRIKQSALNGVDIVKLDKTLETVFLDMGESESLVKEISMLSNYNTTVKYKSDKALVEKTFKFEDGKKVVVNTDISVPDELHKKGYAKKIERAFFKGFKESDIDEITFRATKIGSYAWASSGFYCREPYEVVDAIKFDSKKEQYYDEYKKAVDDYYSTHKKTDPFPMHILAQQRDAKKVLKNIQWWGFLDLNNVDMCSRYEKYINDY